MIARTLRESTPSQQYHVKVPTLKSKSPRIGACAAAILVGGTFFSNAHPARAQEVATVAVDDSPTAQQLLSQAQDQSANNPLEAARLIGRVLDDVGGKLVRVSGREERFTDARHQAEAFLLEHPEVLERFRQAQSGEAQRLESQGDDAQLVRSKFLTTPGMRAAMRLTQHAIDTAQFATADRLLDEIERHPDAASSDKGLMLTLRVLAAWGDGNPAQVQRLLAAAGSSGEPAIVDLVRRLGAVVATPAAKSMVPTSPLMPMQLGPIPADLVRLWSEELDNSLYSRMRGSVEDGAIGSAGLDGALLSGRLLVSVPTVSGSRILINEGYVLRAYDAYSHQPLWYQFLGAPNAPRSDAVAGEMEVVVVAQDRVLALSGHALGAERSGGGRLVCMDLASGAKIWEFSPDRFREQPEFLGMFLYGAPAVVGDTVVVLGRKVNTRMETVSSVLGFDIERGELRWVAQVGAAPGIRMGGARPYTNPTVDGDSVFVASGAGTLARIDATDGRIRWLRRDPVPIRDLTAEAMPWEVGGACMTRRGILTLNPGGNQVQLINPLDGEEIDSMPTGAGTAWGNPRYFLLDAAQRFVYGVGDAIVAFNLDDLRTPAWRFTGVSGDAESRPESILDAAGRSGIRGRVQVGWLDGGRPALVVPLLSHTRIINGDDGSLAAEFACQGPANVVASAGIIAAATNDTLDVYMGAKRAQGILVEAVREQPADADAVVGLIEFAMRAGDAGLLHRAVDGAPQALASVEGDQHRRLRLVVLLVEAAKSGLLGRGESDGLFATVVAATRSAPERAAALLAQGDWLVGSGRPLEALSAWRSLLADRDAADCRIEDNDASSSGVIVQSGGNAALSRLVALASAPGLPPAVHEASQQLPQSASVQEIQSFAQRFPATAEGAAAWVALSRAQFEKGWLARGAGAALAAVDCAIGTGDARTIAVTVGRAVKVLTEQGMPVSSAQALDRCLIAGHDLPLDSHAGATISSLLLQAPGSQAVQNLPLPAGALTSSSPGQELTARVFTGVLAPLRGDEVGSRRNSRAYIVANRMLTAVDSPALATAWTVPLMGDLHFVAPGSQGLLIVEQPDRDSLDAQWIDDQGHPRWRVEGLADAAVAGNAREGADCVVLPGERNLLVVRADGDASAFSLEDGRRTWAKPAVLDQVSCADAGETMAVIGGVRSVRDEQVSLLVALDRISGEAVGEFRLPNDEPVRWVRVISPCEVAFATARGVGRCQVIGSAEGVRWLSGASRPRTVVDGKMLGGFLEVREHSDRSHLINWTSGEIASGLFLPSIPAPTDAIRHWVRCGNRVIAWSAGDVDMYSLGGALIGSASLHGSRRIAEVALASGAVVGLEQTDPASEPRNFGLARAPERLLVHRFGWEDGARVAGPTLQVELPDGRLDRSQMRDGWLLLGGSQKTLAIPLP